MLSLPSVHRRYEMRSAEEKVKIPDAILQQEPKPPKLVEPLSEDGEEDQVEGSDSFVEGFGEMLSEPEEAVFFQEAIPAPSIMSDEEIQEYYREELERLKRETEERAYAEATARKRGELTDCIQRVDHTIAEMQELQAQFIRKYAHELKYLAVDIAEKLILQKIEDDDNVLENLVVTTVGTIKTASWINIEISERLVSLMETLKLEVEKPNYQGKAMVSPVAGPSDTVRVVTNEGTVVSSISVQAQNLREEFQVAEQ